MIFKIRSTDFYGIYNTRIYSRQGAIM